MLYAHLSLYAAPFMNKVLLMSLKEVKYNMMSAVSFSIDCIIGFQFIQCCDQNFLNLFKVQLKIVFYVKFN